jgi:hypothetical protein
MSLDENIIQNKAIQAPPAKKEFHFSGGGTWHNFTVLAETIEEAEKLWHNMKQLINPEQSTVDENDPLKDEVQ